MKKVTTVVSDEAYQLLRTGSSSGNFMDRLGAMDRTEMWRPLVCLVPYTHELERQLRKRGQVTRVRPPTERERRRSEIINAEMETIVATPELLEGLRASEIDILHGDITGGSPRSVA